MNRTAKTRMVRMLIVLVPWFLGGCSGPTNEVSGIVTFDGRPLKAGMVTFFHPTSAGRNVVGRIRPDGSYRVLGCPTGVCKVTVQVLPSKDKTGGSQRNRSRAEPVPPRYTDPATTDLAFEVRGGSQTFDIHLTR